MRTAWQELLERVGVGVLVAGAIVLALATAYLVPTQPDLALAMAGIVLVGVLALVNPVTLPMLAMPLIVVGARVGGGGFDLTVSDAALGLAFWPAVLLSPRPISKPMRNLLWMNAIYQGLTLFTLVANPFRANAIEWVHAWMLVSGAVVVGWAVARAGHARAGLTLFLMSCLALALPTIAQAAQQYLSGNFGAVSPRWPWPMHKNFTGNLMGIAAVVVYARPSWMGWSKRWAIPTMLLLVTALVATQSRQALAGLAVGLLVVSLRKHGERRRATVALAALFPITYGIVTMVRDQIASGNQHNSWFQRLEWYAEAYQISLQKPLFGHGLRYWTQPDAPGAFQPPTAFLEVLASTGLIGLLGFLAMWVGIVIVLYRVNPVYGTLALAVALSRLAQSQFDLFWVSVSVSVPFLLIGVCLGQEAWAGSRRSPEHAPKLVAAT